MTLSEQAKDFDIWMDDIRNEFADAYGERPSLFELMLLEYMGAICWIAMYDAGGSPHDAMEEFVYRRNYIAADYRAEAARILPQPEIVGL